MGTGSGSYGLGESTSTQGNISTVTATSASYQITAAQWNSLFTGMTALANHAAYTITSSAAAAVSTGNQIAARSAIVTNLNNMAAQVAAGCPNTTAVTTSSTLQTATTSSNHWQNTFTGTFTVTFASAAAMRYFFNAGGQVQISGARTSNSNGAASATAVDTTMDALYTALGTFKLGSNYCSKTGSGGTITTGATTTGFYQLTTTNTTMFSLTGDGTYTTSTLVISAKLDASPGSSTVMTVTCVLTDNDSSKTLWTAGNTSGVPAYSNYAGTCNWYLKTRNPTTTYLTTVYIPSSTGVTSATT
jgi:hypothetical protein